MIPLNHKDIFNYHLAVSEILFLVRTQTVTKVFPIRHLYNPILSSIDLNPKKQGLQPLRYK